MMRYRISLTRILPFLLFTLIVSCQGRFDRPVDANESETIVITNNVPDARPISELLENVEYIQLETSSENLINDIKRVFFANNRFYIQNGRSNLLCFDKDGRFLFQVGRNGRGPGEYVSCHKVGFDEERSLIWIMDTQLRKILQYDLEGKYIETKTYDFYAHAYFPLNQEKHYFYLGTRSNSGKVFEDHMLVRTDEDFLFEKAYIPIKHRLAQIPYADHHHGYYYSGDLYVKPDFHNVIYKIEADTILPRYFLDFGEEFISEPELLAVSENGHAAGLVFRLLATGKVFSIDDLLETDSYLFFTYNKQKYVVSNFYCKISKTLYSQRKFEDDIGTGIMYSLPVGLVDDKFIFSLPSHELYDKANDLAKNKTFAMDPYLASILENVDTNDNPILVLAELKIL